MSLQQSASLEGLFPRAGRLGRLTLQVKSKTQKRDIGGGSFCLISVSTAAPFNIMLRPCFPGVWYASGQSGVEKAAYFYGYGWLRALALRGGGRRGELSTATDLGLGYLAEAFHLPFTIPIEV